MANGTAQAAPQTIPAGALFGTPGYTQRTEQRDNNDGMVVNLSQTAQADMVSAGASNFKQTDVVFWWEFDLAITNTVTAGTSTITTSPYFPWNFIQRSRLSIQNMFNPLDVVSGIDILIFQLLRPMRVQEMNLNNMYASPPGSWDAAALPQANLVTSTNYTSTSTAINLSFEIPASIEFDIYYHLDKYGNFVQGVAQPQRAIVSPVYMAGSARYVQPQFTYAQGTVGNVDNGPYNIGTGTGTFAGSVKHAIRRVGIYGSNDPRVMPPVMNPWQYRRMSTNYGIGGKSVIDIPIQAVSQPGQILILFFRFWDPLANGGLGAPINITNWTKCQLQYGSGLLRFDDTPLQMQRRVLTQHNVLLPVGVLAWDLGIDDYGRVSNAGAMNTLTTSGINAHFECNVAVSASAYVVVGVEELVVVE